jgi:hypothetical protein
MNWKRMGATVVGLGLLGLGLYGAFHAGLAWAPAGTPQVARDEFHDLKKRLGGVSKDGRAGTKCGWDESAVCHVPFGRLIALPEKFHGKQILVTGLMAYGPNGVTLYPSEDSARFDLGDGIWLEDIRGGPHGPPPFVPEALWPRLRKGVWVSLVGTFDISDFPQVQTIGILRNVHYVEDLRDAWRAPASPLLPSLQRISPESAKPPQFESQPDVP